MSAAIVVRKRPLGADGRDRTRLRHARRAAVGEGTRRDEVIASAAREGLGCDAVSGGPERQPASQPASQPAPEARERLTACWVGNVEALEARQVLGLAADAIVRRREQERDGENEPAQLRSHAGSSQRIHDMVDFVPPASSYKSMSSRVGRKTSDDSDIRPTKSSIDQQQDRDQDVCKTRKTNMTQP